MKARSNKTQTQITQTRFSRCIINTIKRWLKSEGYRYRLVKENVIEIDKMIDEDDLDDLVEYIESKCRCTCIDVELQPSAEMAFTEYIVYENDWKEKATVEITYGEYYKPDIKTPSRGTWKEITRIEVYPGYPRY